jgi:hypothetical protein
VREGLRKVAEVGACGRVDLLAVEAERRSALEELLEEPLAGSEISGQSVGQREPERQMTNAPSAPNKPSGPR